MVELLIDPKIRDNVFLPMVALMFLINYLRFYMTKVLNKQSNPLLEKPSISFKTLRGTLLESKADVAKSRHCIRREDEGEIDIDSCLKKIKDDVKHGSAMARSLKIRKACHYLPEQSVKIRKAFFCEKEVGYMHQKVTFN